MSDWKLKPCPFCGGEAYSSYGDACWYVMCFDCNAKLTQYMGFEYGAEPMKKYRKMVIDKWNKRVDND